MGSVASLNGMLNSLFEDYNLYFTEMLLFFQFFLTTHSRGLYYIAYLAEGELYKLDKSTKLTIAPGCIGAEGGRCNFDELML